jgi:hypothetical protein
MAPKIYNKRHLTSALSKVFRAEPGLFTKEFRSYYCNRRILMRSESPEECWLLLFTQDHVRNNAILTVLVARQGQPLKACTIEASDERPSTPLPTRDLEKFVSKLLRPADVEKTNLYNMLVGQRGAVPGTIVLHADVGSLCYREGTLSIDVVFKSENTTYGGAFYKVVVLRVRDNDPNAARNDVVAVLFNAERSGRDVYATNAAPLFSPVFRGFMGLYREGRYKEALRVLVDPDNASWIGKIETYPAPTSGSWCLCWTRPLFYVSERGPDGEEEILVEDEKFNVLGLYRILSKEVESGVRYLVLDGPAGPVRYREQHFIFL